MVRECIMCMESLNSAAPPEPPQPPPEANPQHGIVILQNPNNPNSSKVPATRTGKRQPPSGTDDLTVTCATVCGHMFHRVCLDRWFKSNGKKTCPSCRKLLTPSKIIRLFPPQETEEEESVPVINLTGERSVPSCNCANLECREVLTIHEILVHDFNEQNKEIQEKNEEIQLLTAMHASSEEECERLKLELAATTTSPSRNTKLSNKGKRNTGNGSQQVTTPKRRKKL